MEEIINVVKHNSVYQDTYNQICFIDIGERQNVL